jgi:DNA-binding NarL/FixJ family response regulator
VAAALAGVDGEDAGRIADSLADADLLRSGRPLDFVHPFVRSSVYAEIPPARRSTAHAEAAQLLAGSGLPTEEVVTHLLEAEPKGSAWVVTELIKAARLAIDREDISLAAKYLRRANAEPPQPDQQAKVLLIEAEIAGLRGDHATVGHLLEARSRGVDPIEWAATSLKLVELLSSTSDRAAIIELLTAAKDEIADPDLLVRLELADSIFGPSRPMSRRADLRLTTTAVSNSLTEAQRLGVAYAAVCAAADATRSKVEETVDVIVSTLAVELLASAAGPLAVSVTTQAMGLLAAVGRYDMCDRALRIAKDAADERNDPHASAAFALGLAESLAAQGRLREADELISEAVDRTKLTRGSLHERALIVRSQILTTRGEVTRAADLLSTLRLDEWLPDGIVGCTLGLEARGHLHLLDRNWEHALRDFTRSRVVAEDQRITNPTLTSWRSGTCVALTALDRRAEAVEISDEYVDLARRFGAPLQISEALRCAARLAPADVRIQLLREAHDLVAQSGAEIERCRLLIELGRAEREVGDAHGARRHLSHAADLAVRIGAAALAANAGDELRAAGARPRRLRLSGADSLTPSELRVAQLASQRFTNSVIASSLYVSVKTVESHLARAYRKLGVRSRTELTAALDQNLRSS